jgi:hypothetical protein
LLSEQRKSQFELLKLPDPCSNLSAVVFDQLEHVGARWGSAVADTDDVANLGHTQPDRPRSLDER